MESIYHPEPKRLAEELDRCLVSKFALRQIHVRLYVLIAGSENRGFCCQADLFLKNNQMAFPPA